MAPVIVGLVIGVLAIIILIKTAKVVPHRIVFIVERLGKYSRTLESGFHILLNRGDSN